MTNSNCTSAISIQNLRVYFPLRTGLLAQPTSWIKAVDDISFTVYKGETFALVGESGCGKTTTAQAILNLVKKTSGTISIAPDNNPPLTWEQLKPTQQRFLRRQLQVVFQDPISSLNPRMTIQQILEEPFTIHRIGTRAERATRISDLLRQVGLPKDCLNRYPHEFSGGQRQRIGIARALCTEPSIIIADEPVSALDVSIQAQIVNLLQDLKETNHQTLLIISHDLALVKHMADRIAVMYKGRIVEMGSRNDVFETPAHPYTELLLSSIPEPGVKRTAHYTPEEITQPATNGCPFAPRCARASAKCQSSSNELLEVSPGHVSSCLPAEKT